MKKKLLALMLAASCCMSLAGCNIVQAGMQAAMEEAGIGGEEESSEESTEESSEESTEESSEEKESAEGTIQAPTEENTVAASEAGEGPSVTMPSALSDDLYAFQVSVEGVVYQLPMWYSDFVALGWHFEDDPTTVLSSNQYSLGNRASKDGVDITVQMANLSMNEKPYSECLVTSMSFDELYMDDCDWEIVLPGGIQWGVSTKEEVLAAYGTPSYEYEGKYSYKAEYDYDSYQSIEIQVDNESGVVSKIEIDNMIEIEGLDNSVDPTVPEIVKNYKAPTSVGDDLYKFDIQLEGNYYTLPCPVSELVKNGFKIKTDSSDASVGAGSSGWVELQYNNQTYSTRVYNYANYATIIENCFIGDMESYDYGPEFDLVVPCDIKRGDKLEDVEKKLAPFNCEKRVSDNYTYFTVTNPEGSAYDGYEFTVKDGIVSHVEVVNDVKPEY